MTEIEFSELPKKNPYHINEGKPPKNAKTLGELATPQPQNEIIDWINEYYKQYIKKYDKPN